MVKFVNIERGRLWVFGICIILLAVSCARKEADERLASPKKTYNIWLEASLRGDISLIMECMTRASQRFMDIEAKNKDIFIARMVEYANIFGKYNIADEKIKGDKAVVVIIEPKSGSAIAVPFQYEDGGWKVDLIAMFSGMVAEGQGGQGS